MSDRERDMIVPRLLMSLISLTLVGLGVTTILTGHYYGRTSKLGGAEVSLDGPAATTVGISMVLWAVPAGTMVPHQTAGDLLGHRVLRCRGRGALRLHPSSLIWKSHRC